MGVVGVPEPSVMGRLGVRGWLAMEIWVFASTDAVWSWMRVGDTVVAGDAGDD